MPPPACLLPIEIENVDLATFGHYGIVCPPEIARSVPVRRVEFLYGRLAAANALAALGIEVFEVRVGPSRAPLWPPGIIGSITHNRRYAAAVALHSGHYSGVGIDVETVGDADGEQAMLQLVVSPAEADYLRSLSTEIPFATLLTIVFSAKESLFKAAFNSVGRFFDFSAARVSMIDVDAGFVLLVMQETLSKDFQKADIFKVHVDFICDDTVVTSFVW